MRQCILILLFWLSADLANCQSSSFLGYMNPVIPGDHPDCTLTKVGKDFYTTGSSFNPTPVIYHSTDLVHWEAIAQPVSASWSGYGDSPGGGCWGGQMVYYNGKYWDYFSRANTMYFVKADNPKGPWSAPAAVGNPSTLPYGLGYDNSVFIDDNNKWYLVVKNGQSNNGIVELGTTGQPTGVVYDLKWLNPGPSYPYSWAEGPVMWKYGGYYYYSFARDVAGGQKVMRSRTLTADQSAWEMMGDFFNVNDPLKSTSLFTEPNHSSQVVMTGDSTSWVVHPVYAKGEWKGQGRQGLLNQVRYDSKGKPVADYPVNKPFTAPELPSGGIPWMVPGSDFFTSAVLNPEWSFLGYTPSGKYSLTERPGWLRLSPKSSSKANTVIKNDGEHNYSLITRVDFKPKSAQDEAGLRIMRGDETQFAKLFVTLNASGNRTVVFSFGTFRYETEYPGTDTLWLKMVRVQHKITGYCGKNGTEWNQTGQPVDISSIDSYSDFSTWAGTRQGLYVQGTENAWFDLYIYRDAFTPFLAACTANQEGTAVTSASDGTIVLYNIHDGDRVLYAGVEFGDNTYYAVPDSVQFTASGLGAGGMVEVWLDSIGSGVKIADCRITSTGGWNQFAQFTAPVAAVKGKHDVCLRFTGSGSTGLFQLKWIVFTRRSDPVSNSSLEGKPEGMEIYPVPASDRLFIRSGFNFRTAEIFNMNGLRVLFRQQEESDNCLLDLHLRKGVYLLKISSENRSASRKLIVN